MKNRSISILLTLLSLFMAHSAHAFYNPRLGAWISRDPISESGFQSQQATTQDKSASAVSARLINEEYDGEPSDRKNAWNDNAIPNLNIFVGNSPLSYFDILGLKECKVIIWIGHTFKIRPQLKAYSGQPDHDCSKHVVFSCGASKFLTEFPNLLSKYQPTINMNVGGAIGHGSWEFDEDGNYIPYYKSGMSWVQYNEALFQEVVNAGKKEAAKMSLDKSQTKKCCCDKVRLEVHKVPGWKTAPGNIQAVIDGLETYPYIFNVP
jgi:hypothetical protein